MKKLAVFICVVWSSLAFAQPGEGVEAMAGNPQLQQKAAKQMYRANAGTFDSTFIYSQDTISLPVFDEFSTSKFQTYNADYGDAGVTFDKVYRLLDMSNNPISNDSLYTQQPTFRRTYDIANGTFSDTPLPSTQVKIGDLSSYPVSHVTTTVYPPFYIYDTLDFPNPSDTIWITDAEIFQDSATQFFAPVNDPDLIWIDDYAFHNYTMAVEPWSLGVVTFDGLDENGYPYALGSTITNYGDFLTSKPIDMSGVGAADSVYFTFLYQKEGFCDIPEAGDSLVLEFYAKDLDQWKRVWSVNGGGVSDFKVAHMRIDNPDYFKKGFQFRFRNYGGLSGSLDHFHIDYVNLRTLSGHQDTIIHDFAFVYPINTLLDTYTSVPWDHYQNNPTGKMSSNVQVVVRNSDNVPENEQDGLTEIHYGGSLEGSFVLFENLLNNGDLNYLPMTTYTSFHDFSGGYRYDETKPGLYQEFDIISGATHTNTNFTQNDSTYSKQKFENYYSHDDGTAEQAYGPSGGPGVGITPELAIQYTPYEADSLIGIMIHFVPTVNDVSNKLFLLTVWDDNGGEPGNVLYQDNLFFPRQPVYEYARNLFTTYFFEDTVKVPVNGTFYVGWKQMDSERLGVGLDKNIATNDKTFYKTDSELNWNQSAISGSVMIRPLFSTAMDAILAHEEHMEEVNVSLYPNPTTSDISIEVEGMDYFGAEVFNLQGRKVLSTQDSRIQLSDQPAGMYLVKLRGHSKVYKVIKR